MPIAFFDLDRTLVAVNSATLWVKRDYRLGRLTRLHLLRAGVWLALYRLGATRLERVLYEAVATLAGGSDEEKRQETYQFWQDEVEGAIRPGARRAVEEHRRRGDRLVLLTSSSMYISEAAQRTFGLHAFLCTRFQVRDGVLTGQVDGPICFGPGKLLKARQYADSLGEDLRQATFYTDSHADLAVLEAVGHPVCVAPDIRLLREARRRGWPVESWSD